MFDRIHLWSHLVLDLYLLEEIFKITVSVLMIGIHVFYFFLVAPLCWALLWAPKAPLLCQLISLPGMELPQVREPRLTFSSLPRVQVLSCFLSSSFSLLLSFVLSGYKGVSLILLGVWGPLLVFSGWSMRTVAGRDDSTSSSFLASFLSFLLPWLVTWRLSWPSRSLRSSTSVQ